MFFVTALPTHGSRELPRCFGYFPTLAEARGAVARNHLDMHECLYVHLVIEEIGAGIHADAREVDWYRWDFAQGAWRRSRKPKERERYVHFAF